MQKSILFLSLFLILLVSCNGGANKFVGKWKKLDENKDNMLIIEKKDAGYAVYPEKSPDLLLNFTYQKDQDLLTATNYQEVIEIKFQKDSNHIIMNMGNGETHEFEKVE